MRPAAVLRQASRSRESRNLNSTELTMLIMMNRIARGLSILCLAASLVSTAREAAAADCVGDIQTLTLSTGETVAGCTPYTTPR